MRSSDHPGKPRIEVDRTMLQPSVHQIRLREGGRPLDRLSFFKRLKIDPVLRDVLSEAILDSPWPALCWETPVLTRDTWTQPFECVVLASDILSQVQATPGPFREHIENGYGKPEVRQFGNLGGDARLVAPCAAVDDTNYTHLARFLGGAPSAQIHALWSAVGAEVQRWATERDHPVWVSTAGLGVFWLHVRLDSRPKYYRHEPYKRYD
jgi:hypothetical protein